MLNYSIHLAKTKRQHSILLHLWAADCAAYFLKEDKVMPKLKTNKAASKRFTMTGTGKLKRQKAGKQHILTKKTRKNKRDLRKAEMVDKSNVLNMKKMLPYA